MINKKKIEKGVSMILEGIGEDVKREGLRETPRRVAEFYEEIFCGIFENPKFVDIIFISAKIGLISGVFLLARCQYGC